jgi:hypothetical protein
LLSGNSANVPTAGGNGSVNLTTSAGCPWTLANLAPWVTISSGVTGKGSATIQYQVAANAGQPRSGGFTADTLQFTVQQGGACTYSLDSSSANVPATGGNGTVNLTTSAGCAWSITGVSSWITITSALSGSGNAAITYQVAADNGAARSGGFTVAGQTFTVQQTLGLLFVPVTPCRVVDTRNSAGPFGGPTMTTNSTRSFAIPQSACGIPATAAAYSLNVTVVPGGYLGYLATWPTGEAQPNVSTLNSWDGSVVANAAIVPAGSGGAVSVYVTNPTDVILDINGYFFSSMGANAYSFYPATPCRVVDTRGSSGQFGGPSMSTGQTRDFPIPSGSCGIPATARAYSLNVTVVPGGYLGFLTTWPTGQAEPNASTLNSWTGKVVANAAIVPGGTNESISVYVSNPTDVIIDDNGYFAAPGSTGALTFYPVTPCRVVDTRNADGPFGGPEMGTGATRSFAVPQSSCGIPATAAAYSLNVTVVPDGYLGYLTTWPAGQAQPGVSTLNSWDGSVVANAAIVPAGTNGEISIYASNPTQLILDIDGYFAP